MTDWINVRGAREHNLKNIDVAIPKHRLEEQWVGVVNRPPFTCA